MSTPLPERRLNCAEASTPVLPAEGAAPPAPLDEGTVPEAGPSQAARATAPIQVPGYDIMGELGRGGMGAVFKGRDPELGRELAVKVLLQDLQENPRSVQRFLEEAQVGGQLQHPGVVPVYAAGRLPDQRPYFTMKLVEGRTLAALLKERPNPAHDLPRFLQIFEQICQTTAYAHSRGVLHRDLKPLNVMVGAFGEVQVMDWGLAKVMEGRGVRTTRPEQAAWSEAGSVVGTPAYMAPEQACGDADGLDERSDVFGLGAVLCEILTGAPPYKTKDRDELMRQAERADLADAFGRLDGCGADAELVQLAKTCLAAAPAERPRDAGAVAAAMTAHLAGVQERLRMAEVERAAAKARAEEAQAKARAERRARRLTMGLAATVLIAVAGAGAAGLWYQHDQSVRTEERTRKAANTERDATAALGDARTLGNEAQQFRNDPEKWKAALSSALSAVKRAEDVLNNGEDTAGLRPQVDVLRTELESADKDRRMVARPEEARFQEAASGKEGGFDDVGMAALYAEAFREDGLDLSSVGAAAAAERINGRAIRDDLLAALADWSAYAPNQDERQRLGRVREAADPDPGSLRNRWNAVLAREDWDTLQVLAVNPETTDQPPALLVEMARGLYVTGDPTGAVNLLTGAKERHPGDFWIYFELAYAHEETKPPAMDEAIRYLTTAAALRPASAAAHTNLGVALQARGRLDEAMAEYRQSLRIQPDGADAHNNLGHALAAKGQLDEAVAEFRQSLRIRPDDAGAHHNLGLALKAQGRVDEAVAEYRQSLRIQPDGAEAHTNLGIALAAKGQLDEAVAEFRQALRIRPDLAEAHYNLGVALHAKGMWDEAMAEFRQALRIRPDYAEAHYNLGVALDDKGRLDEAMAEFRQALRIQPDGAEAHTNLGSDLAAKGQLDEAVAEFRLALRIRPDGAIAHNNLGAALADKGRWDEAVAECRQALQIQPDFALANNNLRRVLTLAQRDLLLPAVLRGEAVPADAAQQIAFADFCQRYKRLYAAASRFYAGAFAAEPPLAADLSSGARYNAACAAALAGCGQGEDAAATDAQERGRWRKQALDWLRADLTLQLRQMGSFFAATRKNAADALQHWKEDADLSGVRDADALAKLPADEQDAWRKLWADVDAAAKKAQVK